MIVAEILSNTKQTVVKVVTTAQTNVSPPISSTEEKPKDKEKVNIKLTISDVKIIGTLFLQKQIIKDFHIRLFNGS